MTVLSQIQVLEALCKATKRHGIYFSFCNDKPEDFFAEVLKAAPYLNRDEHLQVLFEGCGIILCDSAEERDRLFGLTVGDDGPTPGNPYDGPVRVFCISCDDTGQTLSENT